MAQDKQQLFSNSPDLALQDQSQDPVQFDLGSYQVRHTGPLGGARTSVDDRQKNSRFRIHAPKDWLPGIVFKVRCHVSDLSELQEWDRYLFDVQGSTGNDRDRYEYSGTRAFLVLASDDDHSTCLPITAARWKFQDGNILVFDAPAHGDTLDQEILGHSSPDSLDGFAPIRVRVAPHAEPLMPGCRVCYPNVATIEHNCHISIIGQVNNRHLQRVLVALGEWSSRAEAHSLLLVANGELAEPGPASSERHGKRRRSPCWRPEKQIKHFGSRGDVLTERFTKLGGDRGGREGSSSDTHPSQDSSINEHQAAELPVQAPQSVFQNASLFTETQHSSSQRMLLPRHHSSPQAPGSLSTTNDWSPSRQATSVPAPKPTRPTSREDYEIAFICALPTDKTAVQAMFEHDWDEVEGAPKYGATRPDTNAYSHGRIGNYNVVVANIGGIGKKRAAVAAAHIRHSWPKIQLILVVGVCGAVPNPSREIILGDVIMSSGVVQYDFGRMMEEGFVPYKELEDLLSGPTSKVRSHLDKFRGVIDNRRLRARLARNLARLEANPRLKVTYPGAEHDLLFGVDDRHAQDGRTCLEAGCGVGIPRQRLADTEGPRPPPAVHIGLIGSADKLMKSAFERDRIAKEEGVIAFEMEGAGAWGDAPCLVIKGVSNYADSHKTDLWQSHAAAAAAACAVAFLDDW